VMVVIVIENAHAKLRGELTKWLTEVIHGTFVGTISAVVRNKIWEKIKIDENKKGAILLYSYNNEQGFCMEMCGCPRRKVYELDGVQLVYVSNRETNDKQGTDIDNVENIDEIERLLREDEDT